MEANFWNEMRKIRKHLNQFFTYPDFFECDCGSDCKPHQFRKARGNFKETEDSFVIALEIPGVSKQDIKVNLTDDVLEIKAERKVEKTSKPEKDSCCEEDGEGCHGYSYMKSSLGFFRRIALPEQADTESINKIQAVYKDGILRLVIPKKKTSKKDNQIRVD